LGFHPAPVPGNFCGESDLGKLITDLPPGAGCPGKYRDFPEYGKVCSFL